MLTFVLIGCCDYFGVGFTTLVSCYWQTFYFEISWKSIANDEDVSDAVGENAARSWTRRCNHTEGMRQQHLVRSPFLASLSLLVEVVKPLFFKPLNALVDGLSPDAAVCCEGFPSKTRNGAQSKGCLQTVFEPL